MLNVITIRILASKSKMCMANKIIKAKMLQICWSVGFLFSSLTTHHNLNIATLFMLRQFDPGAIDTNRLVAAEY